MRAEHLPDVFHALEVIAAIAQQMGHVRCPALQLAQAGADVGPRDAQRRGDLLGMQRARREEQQRVDLRHGSVDAQRVPIAQWRMNFCWIAVKAGRLRSVISVRQNYRIGEPAVKPPGFSAAAAAARAQSLPRYGHGPARSSSANQSRRLSGVAGIDMRNSAGRIDDDRPQRCERSARFPASTAIQRTTDVPNLSGRAGRRAANDSTT